MLISLDGRITSQEQEIEMSCHHGNEMRDSPVLQLMSEGQVCIQDHIVMQLLTQ